MSSTKSEYLQDVAEQYRSAGEEWPATAKMIAAWAIQRKLWEPARRTLIDQCARELADAMREDCFTDPQGRRVRRKHVIREAKELSGGSHEQLVLWVDIRDASPQQMQAAFQLRRTQILGDCRQLKVDVDSYNENNCHNARIQMVFDFTEDLAELDEPAEYVGLDAPSER